MRLQRAARFSSRNPPETPASAKQLLRRHCYYPEFSAANGSASITPEKSVRYQTPRLGFILLRFSHKTPRRAAKETVTEYSWCHYRTTQTSRNTPAESRASGQQRFHMDPQVPDEERQSQLCPAVFNLSEMSSVLLFLP